MLLGPVDDIPSRWSQKNLLLGHWGITVHPQRVAAVAVQRRAVAPGFSLVIC